MADESSQTFLQRYPFLPIILAVMILVVGGVGWYFYTQYQSAQKLLKNPASIAQQKDKETIQKVAKLMDLPNEQPTLAEVSDKEKLKSQSFFAHAENGDKVLIFTKAKKAILYRASTNKIIEVGPVTLTDPTPTAAGSASSSAALSPTRSKSVQIAIYNGTNTVGLTAIAEKKLSAKNPQFLVILKDNAVKKPYEKTLIIDLSGTNKESIAVLAKEVGGAEGKLPVGEAKPSPEGSDGKTADILIILGNDFVK
ncbi:hypothetical protein BH11PAT1_BH11PAT1_0210 [soil metagenome]